MITDTTLLRGREHDRIVAKGPRGGRASGTGLHHMYRVIAIVGGALALAGCSSSSDWFDSFKPAPVMDTVRFESTPPGADVKAPNGQTCRTPCALALPTNGPITVTFALNGYVPESADLEPVTAGFNTPELHPNPVAVELSPAPPPPKPVRKPAHHKKVAAKPKPVAAPAAAPAPAAQTQQQQTPASASPWPTTPPPPHQ